MKIEKSIQFLDFLLEPLGMRITGSEHRDFLMFDSLDANAASKSLNVMVTLVSYAGYGLQNSVDDVLSNLFNNIAAFIVCGRRLPSGKKVEEKTLQNPYLGCQSLEEAMIKRDLMSDED